MIYLDNAATSWPKPRAVYNEVSHCMKTYCANPGRSGHRMAFKAAEKIYECRDNLARLFGIADPLNIIFTANTTEGLNLAIKGLLNPGDHVIITSLEHNSVLRPLKKIESSWIDLSIVQADPDGRIHLADIKKEIQPRTKLIITTHASNVMGTLVPVMKIGELAKAHKLIYMVDAAQTAGIYPIDVEWMNIDILAFPGHKGLLGPQGTGGLYIRDGLVLDTLKEGGTGSVSESPYQPDFSPDRFESGTLNTPGIAGLNEGIKYIMKNGIEQILFHETKLTEILLDGLSEIKKVHIYGNRDAESRVGVVSLNIEGKDCVDVCNQLDEEFGIASRGGLHCSYLAHQTMGTLECGAIRLSVGCFNEKKHISAALNAINKIAKL